MIEIIAKITLVWLPRLSLLNGYLKQKQLQSNKMMMRIQQMLQLPIQ